MFIARQPIFNRSLKIYGYELLYRDSESSTSFGSVSSSKATASVLGDLFESGIESIVEDARAFINFDHEFLLSDSIELIDSKKLIIEILEGVQVNEEILERLKELKDKGYRLALDDFEKDYNTYPIVPMADIIKYDILATPLDSLEMEINKALSHDKIILAEKIETELDYEKAKEMGFHLFQGYFFSRPSIISKGNNRKSTKLHYFRLISELKKPEPSYDELAGIIESDVNLAYRLLRVTKNKQTDDVVESIKRALILMGLAEIERWINILMLQDLAVDKPMELMRVSLVRSKLGEIIAKHSKFKNRSSEISMMCLFSTLNAVLDQPMEEALEGIMISDSIKQALIEQTGDIRPILDLIVEYEKGNWEQVKAQALLIGADKDEIMKAYLEAVEFTKDTIGSFG